MKTLYFLLVAGMLSTFSTKAATFPNPTHPTTTQRLTMEVFTDTKVDLLMLFLQSEDDCFITFEIYNQAEKNVFSQDEFILQGDSSLDLNIDKLQLGHYILVLKDAEGQRITTKTFEKK